MSESIADHLAMVFHRFLAGETSSRRRLTILFNGDRLEPWDPFARTEPATRKLAEQRLAIEHGGATHTVVVRPYVLPSQVAVLQLRGARRAAGPKKWNRQQGFYIYRGDRMIQSGGWNRLRTTDEHSKLARIAIDVPDRARGPLPDQRREDARFTPRRCFDPGSEHSPPASCTVAQDAYRHRLRLVTETNGGPSADSDRARRRRTTRAGRSGASGP